MAFGAVRAGGVVGECFTRGARLPHRASSPIALVLARIGLVLAAGARRASDRGGLRYRCKLARLTRTALTLKQTRLVSVLPGDAIRARARVA